MMSVTNMLNDKSHQQPYKRPSVLDINSLLNDINQQEKEKSPSLSPSLTCSPSSVSSNFSNSYPFPTQQHWDESFYNNNKLNNIYNTPPPPISSMINMQEEDHDMDMSNKSIESEQEEEVEESEEEDDDDDNDSANGSIKAKRRRANSKQLQVLNRVFDRTFFPSTQMRAELGRQLGMSPRTVQIWFQNKRQAMRTRERQRLSRLCNNEKKTTTTTTTITTNL